MTTYGAFLAAIIADPGNDDLRLIFADELEQDGHGERAEFIRLQIRLATGACRYNCRGPIAIAGLEECDECRPLRHRERELLAENWTDWAGLPPGRLIRCLNLTGENPGDGIAILFRRGFVSEARTTLAVWWGGECQRCDGTGDRPNRNGTNQWSSCPNCHGTGQIEGIGPAVVKYQPVEVVTLTDKRPYYSAPQFNGGHQRYLWFSATTELAGSHLGDLFAFLPGGDRPIAARAEYATEAAALAALSAAAILFTKGKHHVS